MDWPGRVREALKNISWSTAGAGHPALLMGSWQIEEEAIMKKRRGGLDSRELARKF